MSTDSEAKPSFDLLKFYHPNVTLALKGGRDGSGARSDFRSQRSEEVGGILEVRNCQRGGCVSA